MSLTRFDFFIHVSDAGHFEQLLDELSAGLLRSVGLEAEQLEQMAPALRNAVGTGPCDVTFHATPSELLVTIAASAAPPVRLSYPLPD